MVDGSDLGERGLKQRIEMSTDRIIARLSGKRKARRATIAGSRDDLEQENRVEQYEQDWLVKWESAKLTTIKTQEKTTDPRAITLTVRVSRSKGNC